MEEQISPGSPAAQLKATSILFNALLIGVLLMLIIAVGLIKFGGKLSQFDDSFDNILLFIAGVVAVMCVLRAFSGYRKRLNTVDISTANFDVKFNSYRAAMIFYLALCEGPALLAVIAFMLTGNYWFVMITLVMLAAMFVKRPTKEKVINELQLSSQDQAEL
jgi:hypothetical protein